MGEEHVADQAVTPRDRPPAEEVFAERVARLVELVERWQAQVVMERWPAVPLADLDRNDPRRITAEVAGELLRARGHLFAAVERVRRAAALRRRRAERLNGGPDP